MLILSASDLIRALPVKEAISAMEEVFRLADGDVHVPVRTLIPLAARAASFLVMPALGESLQVFGTKIVSVIPGNSQSGLEPIQASYALVSTSDGRLLALMDGKYLTAVRTAATSALATRLMARDVPSRLAIIGTGTQARFHLEAISLVREIVEARACGTSPEKSEAFVLANRSRFPFSVRATSSKAAVTGADIICACTNSPTPVFEGAYVQEGTHINAVGAYRPETRELDDTVIRRARIVVDSLAAVMAEAGDILLPLKMGLLRKEQIVGELSHIVRGTFAGRLSAREITVFKSVGFALQDLGAGLRAYRNAMRLGLGLRVELQESLSFAAPKD